MEYRLLGLSGCAVSALALGTLTFGNETIQTDSFAQLDRLTSAGGTLIDTADVDADGRSEQTLWPLSRPSGGGGPRRPRGPRRPGPPPWGSASS
jgi:aryl-alcohol dehydrogenase-like predicted oxidoreductase